MSFEILLRLILLSISFYGYVHYLSRNIKLEFSIGVIFVSIGTIMFFAGILNVMPVVANIIFVVGVILSVLSLKTRKSIKDFISPGIVFFVIINIYFVFILKGSYFIDGDNFTHWAFATRSLITYNRFPNFSNPLAFYAYPLGSASFIYYICKISGIYSDWMFMFAQTLLMIGVLTGIFAFAKNKKENVITAFICIMLLCSNTALVDLLVDTYMPAVAVGAISFCIYYKDKLHEKMEFIIPYVIFLAAIKNSGLFFAVIILSYLWCTYIYENLPMKRKDIVAISIKKLIVCSIAPFITVYLWQRHVKMVYGYDAFFGNHAMTLEYYQTMFGLKNENIIVEVTDKFITQMVSIHNPIIYMIIAIIVIILINRYYFKTRLKETKLLLLFAMVSYVFYQIGMLAMYIFSMSPEEAINLVCYDRYHRTILIFIAAVVCIAVLNMKYVRNQNNNSIIKETAFLILIVMFIGLSTRPNYTYCIPQDLGDNHKTVVLDNFIKNGDVEKGKSYLLLNNHEGVYLTGIEKYMLAPESISQTSINSLKEDESVLQNVEYLLVLEENEEIANYIKEKYKVDIPVVIDVSQYN